MTDAPDAPTVDFVLDAVTAEIETYVSARGWDHGAILFALVETATLVNDPDTAATLGRVTGLQHVPSTVPRRLGEILREPVLFGAAAGGVMSLLWLRERARLGAVVGVLSLAAFCVLAAAGLPILGRYLLLPASIGTRKSSSL